MIAKNHRFHGHNSLSYAYKQGRVVRNAQLSLRYIRNDKRTEYRVAVVVSKKTAKSAVVRNRIRRRIYEVVRAQHERITAPYDLIVTVFGAELAVMDAASVQKLTLSMLQKAGVIQDKNITDHAIVKTKGKGQ